MAEAAKNKEHLQMCLGVVEQLEGFCKRLDGNYYLYDQFHCLLSGLLTDYQTYFIILQKKLIKSNKNSKPVRKILNWN